ncbi:MAG TPA: polysaccharide biosynthesis tyrosine autokinase [Sphingomicrobium sp.]|nr:polysaccharide biosynthesis tyrosine autokinase [Sphingomicrobium sp.]
MNLNRNDLVPAPHGLMQFVGDGAAVLEPEYALGPNPNDAIDLRKLWSAAWRHRLLILAVLGISLALGVLSLFLSHPIYQATASIEIENQPTKVLGTEDFQQIVSAQETDRLLQTQIDILHSRALAERVVADLNLARNSEFAGAQPSGRVSESAETRATGAVQKGLVVSLPHNTRVVPVSFESTDPALAARIANAYVDNLISGNLQRHFDTSAYAKEFLQNQLEITKARLEQSEQALLTYARSVGIVDPNAGAGEQGAPATGPRSLTTANLIDLNQSLAQAQANRIQAEGRWHEAAGTPLMNLPDVLSNPAIQQMTQKRAELQADYQEQLQHRKADYPAVQQAAAAIKELDSQIAALASSIRNSIHNQYVTAQQQESQLSSTVGQLKGATLAEQQLGIRYNILKREVDTNRELYDGLLQRYKEVSAEAGVTSNNISIIDRAETPLLPVSPRPLVNLSIAALLGALIAFLVVAALEIFYDGIRTPEEVEARFGVPLLGHTPMLASARNAVAELTDPESPVAEAYQTVRASLELSSEAGTPKTLLVTSSRAGEGKSTTALAMARDAALSGRSVLLIDADMRRPSLHKLLGTSKEPGLSNFLTQQMAAESIVQQTDIPGLSFVASGPKPPSPAELVSGGAIRTLLTYLSSKYDQIIIDSPPVLGLADAPRLASIVDATVLVIEANTAPRGTVQNALKRLAAAKADIVGAVLSKFDWRKADPGTAYRAEQYYSYGADEDVAPLIEPIRNVQIAPE